MIAYLEYWNHEFNMKSTIEFVLGFCAAIE